MPLAGRSATQPRGRRRSSQRFLHLRERPRAAGARGAGLSSSPSAPTSALSADARTTPGAVARSLGESPIGPYALAALRVAGGWKKRVRRVGRLQVVALEVVRAVLALQDRRTRAHARAGVMKLRDVRPQTEHQNSGREGGDHGSCLGGPCIPPGPGQLNQHPKEEDRLWVKVARRIRHPNEPARGRSRGRHQRDEAGYSGPERRPQLPPSQRRRRRSAPGAPRMRSWRANCRRPEPEGRPRGLRPLR